MAVIASCAFLSFAADTIFMALVICMVEETDAIRLRISLRFAMLYALLRICNWLRRLTLLS